MHTKSTEGGSDLLDSCRIRICPGYSITRMLCTVSNFFAQKGNHNESVGLQPISDAYFYLCFVSTSHNSFIKENTLLRQSWLHFSYISFKCSASEDNIFSAYTLGGK